MRSFATLADFAAATSQHLGYSPWHEITQDQVDGFADVTGDRQWIHVDPTRAARTQFGGTIAHGYLTLALVPVLMSEIFRIESLTMSINIGLNRARFPAPVMVGSRVRGGAELISLKNSPAGKLSTIRATVEVEGRKNAGCVAEILALLNE
jgi:acyl dehydratase